MRADAPTLQQLNTQYGNKGALALTGAAKVAGAAEKSAKKKRWFRKSAISAFGIDHGETTISKGKLKQSWQLGGTLRSLQRANPGVGDAGSTKAFMAAKENRTADKAVFLASKHRGKLAVGAVGIGGGAAIEGSRRYRKRRA